MSLKSALISLLSWTRRPGRDCSSLLLAYHNIAGPRETGYGDASLHLSIGQFERQASIARDHADIVSVETLVAELGRPGRRIAFSFDDAYWGSLEHGLAICTSSGIVPTVFVAPALCGRFTQWDVSSAMGAWNDSDRAKFLTEQRGMSDHFADNSHGLPESYRIATLEELREFSKSYVFQVGNHSYHHPNFSAIEYSEAVLEIESAADVLRTSFGNYLHAFAFPYGLHRSDPLLSTGVIGSFAVEGGWISNVLGAKDVLPRVNVPAGMTDARFKAVLNGWF
jgi:peptidoglycan/xylan/chitin deacetylase (PgdA/CDA1 family)